MEQIKKQKHIIIILSVIIVALLSLLAVIIYTNFDYLMFKTIMTKGYIYEDSLQFLIDEELDQTDSDIDTYFDDAVINIFSNRLYEISSDRYTHIYLPVQYASKIESEQEVGNSCVWYPITDEIAYLAITNFTNESANYIKENSDKIAEADKLILDLRGNPGGYINSARAIASMFIEKGSVISIESAKMPFLSKTIKSNSSPVFDFEKIVILQDSNTASSAEILIGALKDNLENVVLMGETTYGKGIGQYTVPLKNNFYFIATMFTWETPNGNVIHEKGIEPDCEFTIENLSDEIGEKLVIANAAPH